MALHGQAVVTASRTIQTTMHSRAVAYRFQAAFKCQNSACKRLVIADSWGEPSQKPASASDQSTWDAWKNVTWTPAHVGGRDFPDVPAEIAAAADEAYRCRSIGAFRAAIILARSVLEAVAKDKGIDKGLISKKIDELAAAQWIRPFTQDAAHELRFLGNDMAHGDFVNAVNDEDCDSVLDVMSEVLNEVYQGPARVARMRTKRTARKAALPEEGVSPHEDESTVL